MDPEQAEAGQLGPEARQPLLVGLEQAGAGVEYLWAGEACTADAVSTMGFMAAVTSRAQIGSAILPLYTRTPSLLAMTGVGLDGLSGGRFILGIGASGPQVVDGFHDVPYDAPLARTEEIIEICRSVWRRDRLVHTGAKYQVPLAEGQGTGLGKPLKLITHPVRDRIPVYVASLGPKNVAMRRSSDMVTCGGSGGGGGQADAS
jgi:F420-dependent oxidoreductase-like protein